jgi:hypothetical protein
MVLRAPNTPFEFCNLREPVPADSKNVCVRGNNAQIIASKLIPAAGAFCIPCRIPKRDKKRHLRVGIFICAVEGSRCAKSSRDQKEETPSIEISAWSRPLFWPYAFILLRTYF